MTVDQWNEDTVTVNGVKMTLKSYLAQKASKALDDKVARDSREVNRDADKYGYVKRHTSRRCKRTPKYAGNVVLSTRVYRKDEIRQEEEARMAQLRKRMMTLIVNSAGKWVSSKEYKRQFQDEPVSSVSSTLTRQYQFFNEKGMMERKKDGVRYMYRFDKDERLANTLEKLDAKIDEWYNDFLKWENDKRISRQNSIEKSTRKLNERKQREEEKEYKSIANPIHDLVSANSSISGRVKVDVTIKVLFGWLREKER